MDSPAAITTAVPAPKLRLTFDWTRRATWWRLLLFLLLSAALHAGMFYLLKVVTPSSTRPMPRPEAALVIREGDPAAAGVLRHIEENSPMALLSGTSHDVVLAELRASLPAYEPSFQEYLPTPRELPEAPESVPQLVSARHPVLPPLPQSQRPTATATATSATGPRLALSQSLAARPPKSLALSADLTPPDEPGETFTFTLAIDHLGRVVHSFSDAEVPMAVMQAIQQLQFGPSAQAGLTWGEIEVYW